MKNEIQEKLYNKTKDLNKTVRIGANKNLADAKQNKNDEFYTRYDDIMAELSFYGDQGLFKGKRIILPCDQEYINLRPLKKEWEQLKELGQDTTELRSKVLRLAKSNSKANFHRVLTLKQQEWGIKSITTSYWDGTLTDEENIAMGNKKFQDVDYSLYDIVITNPPFSLFRELIALMEEKNMKYLFVGNTSASGYKELFKLVHNGSMWLGRSGIIQKFNVIYDNTHPNYNNYKGNLIAKSDDYAIVEEQVGVGAWFTNLGTPADRPLFEMTEIYEGNEHKYPKYDNYDAINVNKGKDIPMDYMGVMGVPITFLHKLNNNQFEIVGFRKGVNGKDLCIDGVSKFQRLLIRRKV